MKKLVFGLIATVMFSVVGNAQKSTNGTYAKFILVSWDEWGRASRDCKSWGLCNAEWFHCKPDPCFGKTGSSNFSSQLQFNEKKEEFYIEIVLDNKTKEKFKNEDLSILPVDLDIVFKTKEFLGRDLTISKGKYSFDSSSNSYLIILK
jgi:hypothetical protein